VNEEALTYWGLSRQKQTNKQIGNVQYAASNARVITEEQTGEGAWGRTIMA